MRIINPGDTSKSQNGRDSKVTVIRLPLFCDYLKTNYEIRGFPVYFNGKPRVAILIQNYQTLYTRESTFYHMDPTDSRSFFFLHS